MVGAELDARHITLIQPIENQETALAAHYDLQCAAMQAIVSFMVPPRTERNHDPSEGPIRLDETDKAIIQHLQSDGRMPYTKLGPLVGLSAPATRQRVLHLIDSGVMEVVAVTDPRTLGFEIQALMGIHTSGGPEAAASFMADFEEVDYLAITTGRFDMICEVVCENNDHLLDLMNRLGAHESIASIEVFSFVRLVKQTYDWGTR